MSTVGDDVEHGPTLRPEDWEDPEPMATGYFVIWGFVLLFAMIVALEFVHYANEMAEIDRKGRAYSATTELKARRTGLDPHLSKAEQLSCLKSPQAGGKVIEQAMNDIVREYGSKQ